MPAKRGTTIPETGWKRSNRSEDRDRPSLLRCNMAVLGRSVGGADEHLFNALKAPVHLLARDGQRRSEAEHGAVGILGEHTLAGHLLAQSTGRDGFGINLDADPQAAPTHVGDDVAADRAQPLVEVGAEFGATLDQTLVLDHVERS